MIKAIWNKNLEEVYNAQLSLPKNIQNLTVTGSKQNQMVSSVAESTVLMQYSPNQGLLM